ncbi:GIN domain-containing protein [Brevundimonas sp.]|uniref:GIN domain-containing protein n=1 Tax=Brevundimonas sp. TaxID=1871086 RepID=UPI003F71661B
MKLAIATAVSAVALAAMAGPAFAGEPNVEIRYAVARVAVVVEDRADVAVEVEQGSSRLPRVEVTRVGDEIRVNGGLRRRSGLFNGGSDGINNCHNGPDSGRAGEGASVEVRGIGRVNVSDAPLIVIRTPRNVDVNASGAIYGSVGRGARSLDLGHGGCGRWDVANVDGPVSLSIGGSGDIRAGTSASLEVAIGGSGSVTAGATRDLDVSIGGSGDVMVSRIDGPLEVAIGGSGDVDVRGGNAPKVDISIAGSGDVNFGGVAGDVDVSIVGGGDVAIARATGSVSRSIMGGGDVRIGN